MFETNNEVGFGSAKMPCFVAARILETMRAPRRDDWASRLRPTVGHARYVFEPEHGYESPDLADRAQVRQLPVGIRDRSEPRAERSRLRSRELGPHPRLDQERRERVLRVEHGARHRGPEPRHGAPVGAERAARRGRAGEAPRHHPCVLRLSPPVAICRPGAKVVATNGGDALAFKNPDGAIVTVLYNSGAARTAIVSAKGKLFQFDVPGNGWATVNVQ